MLFKIAILCLAISLVFHFTDYSVEGTYRYMESIIGEDTMKIALSAVVVGGFIWILFHTWTEIIIIFLIVGVIVQILSSDQLLPWIVS